MSRRLSATLVAAGVLAASLVVVAIASANHPAPANNNTGVGSSSAATGAGTSFRVPVVPAYKPCRAVSQGGANPPANGLHSGVPGESCLHAAETLAAGKAQLVSNVAYQGPTSIGWAQLSLKSTGPGQDILIKGNSTDVRCKTAGTGGCAAGQIDYNPVVTPAGPYTGPVTGSGPNTAPGPACTSLATCFGGRDMTATAEIPLQQIGGLNAGMPLTTGSGKTEHRALADRAFHTTDHYNSAKSGSGPASCNTVHPTGFPASDTTAPYCQGTTQDSPFPVPVVCTTVGTATTAPGSSCGVNTSANALVPGAVVDGKRSVIEVGQIEIYDAGANAVPNFPGAGDDKIVSRQGINVP